MKLGWIDRPTKTNDELYYPWAVYRCLLLLDFYCTSHFVGPPLEELSPGGAEDQRRPTTSKIVEFHYTSPLTHHFSSSASG